jgi:hypothetical protein
MPDDGPLGSWDRDRKQISLRPAELAAQFLLNALITPAKFPV